MNLSCDHCPRTASGSEAQLLDAGWAWIQVSTPFRRRFVACPKHGTEMGQATLAAIDAARGRRTIEEEAI